MNVIQRGENYFHVLLPQLEQDVAHIVSVAGGKVMLHRILATGEVVSSQMNMDVLRSILQAVDSAVSQG